MFGFFKLTPLTCFLTWCCLHIISLFTIFGKGLINKLLECKKYSGKLFKVILWHVNLTEQNCKDFVKRNEHLLFEINTQITKRIIPVWFSIGDGKDDRYRCDGDILTGISQYLKIINHIKKRDGE